VRQFLHTLEESTRAQFRWSVDSNYRKELLSYKAITDERCEPDSWTAIARNERFNRYWQAMQVGTLRREKLVLFLSKRMNANPPATTNKKAIADYYRRILAQFNEAFDQHRGVIVSLFEPHGCGISAMSTEDLFRYYATFLNPSTSSAKTTTLSDNFERTNQSSKTAGTKVYRREGISDFSPTDSITISSSSNAVRSAPGAGSSGRSPRSHFVITQSPSISTRRTSEPRLTGRKNPWSAFVATIALKASIPCSHPRKSKNSGSTNSPEGMLRPSNTISLFTSGTEPRTV
jgi:hypothetical protein